jgi:hypothetical protein
MSGPLPPDDQEFRDDKELMADLATLNEQVRRYVLRMLDVDAKRTKPVSAADERRFAQELRTLADRLEARADRRAPSVIEGDATLGRQTIGRPSERC